MLEVPEQSQSTVFGTFPASPPAVLVVDDEQEVTSFLSMLLARQGYVVRIVHDGAAALRSVTSEPPDIVLLDVMLPGLDGFEICRRLKRQPETRLTPVILITGLTAREDRIKGLDAGADEFLRKPVDTQELLTRVRALSRVKRFTDDLDSAAAIIMTLATMIESRDGHAEGHCHRMANYATALGRSLQLGSEGLQALHRGGFLHDIGMLTIPEAVLRKSGALEPDEYELIKSHTVVGDSLVSNLRSLQTVRSIIRHHHERFDGSGYPDGLRGDEIPLLAQITGLVDAFDALTTASPYQAAKSIPEAVDVLRMQAHRGWRKPDLVEQFVSLVQTGKLSTLE